MNFHRLKGYGNASLDATVAKRRERGNKSRREMAAKLVVALSTGRRLPPVRVIRVRVPLEALRLACSWTLAIPRRLRRIGGACFSLPSERSSDFFISLARQMIRFSGSSVCTATGPFSVDKRIVPLVPFICSVRPSSRQALRHFGALHDIGTCPEVSSRNPERKFSGSETAIGPLMVRASNCDPD